MYKKLLNKISIALVLVLLASCVSFAEDASEGLTPADVKGKSYEPAIEALYQKEIISGDTDGLFHPENNLTRAQACVIIAKAMNPPVAYVSGTATQPVIKSGFSDMKGYSWAEGYVSFALKQGVTKGYPDGTFKPANNVTINEFITMAVRASGYTDTIIGGTWPANYTDKAKELGISADITSNGTDFAKKWMAAQISYNALALIEKQHPDDDGSSQQGEGPTANGLPDTSEMTYLNGSFNAAMTTYAGKTLAQDVKVYSYGVSKDYKAEMTFSKKLSDYKTETVSKYKNVKTPAFYKFENNEITSIVVPMNVGYSGRAYGVINSTVQTINYDDDNVTGAVTLTATKEITWLGEKGLAGIPTKVQYLSGEVYEFNLSDGEIQSIYKSTDVGKKGDVFNEISGNTTSFVDVLSYENGIIKITAADGGAMFNVKSNASVYILDKNNPTEYTVGRNSSIKAGVEVRAYDVLDDDDASADIVVVKK